MEHDEFGDEIELSDGIEFTEPDVVPQIDFDHTQSNVDSTGLGDDVHVQEDPVEDELARDTQSIIDNYDAIMAARAKETGGAKRRKAVAPVKHVPIIKPKTKKAHRFRPGTVALREIRKLQKGVDLLIPKTRFLALVREIAAERYCISGTLRFEASAVVALQTAAEEYLTSCFRRANILAIHARRVTVLTKDMNIATKLHLE